MKMPALQVRMAAHPLRSTLFLLASFLVFSMAPRPAKAQICAAYVANTGGSVAVVDTATNTVTTTVSVPGNPFYLAVRPDGQYVYVADPNSSGVSVIFTGTNTVIGPPISVGSGPFGIAIGPSGAFAYVANNGASSVSVINTGTNTVSATIPLSGGSPYGIAVTPNGSFAYVTNLGSPGNVRVIDLATNSAIGLPIVVGNAPQNIAITPNGAFAYVTNTGSHAVSVISTSSNSVVATIPVGIEPFGIAITPSGAFAYVAHMGSQDVRVIETSTNTVVGASIAMGPRPTGVAIRPDGGAVYVSDDNSVEVRVIDTSSNTVVGSPITPAGGGFAIAIASVQNGCAPPPTYTPVSTATATATPMPSDTPANTPTDTAAPVATPTPTSAPCGATPREICAVAGLTALTLKDKSGGDRDLLKWRWVRGAETTLQDLGLPTADTQYSLCVYDRSAGMPHLVRTLSIPAGGNCAGNPCWRSLNGNGFKYSDPGLSPDGIRRVLLRTGAPGKARITLMGQRSNLALPGPAVVDHYFDQDQIVTVQLVNSLQKCWTADFLSPAQRNDGEQFKDRELP